jgi:peptidoglycan/LPS O-acetylase OafA/YrhL
MESESSGEHMQAQELQSLTPLRGIAAIWVICFHYGVVYFAFHPEQFSWVFNKGYLAVDMFFMLSGFILSHVYWEVFASAKMPRAREYWSFIGARIARLYPLHLFNLGLFLVATLSFSFSEYLSGGTFDAIPLHGAHSITALLANIFMLQGLKESELAWNYPAWSISIEFMAYFLFPLALPQIARTGGGKRWFLGGLAYLSLCLFSYLANGDFNQWNGPITLMRCLPEFTVGALIYASFRESSWPKWLKQDYSVVIILCVILMLLHVAAPDLIIVSAFPVVILSVVMNAGRISLILNSAPLVWLGEISYSLYLAHGFVQFVASQVLVRTSAGEPSNLPYANSISLLLAMACATLVIATFTYREIESVGRSRLRRLFQPQATTDTARSVQRPNKNARV